MFYMNGGWVFGVNLVDGIDVSLILYLFDNAQWWVESSGDTRQIFLSRVSTSEYRQPPSIRRVFQTNAHR